MAGIIVNGTFDNNTSGWNGSYTAHPGGEPGNFPVIDTGSYFFAGSNASNSITQIYDLTATDLSFLSSSGLNFNMSADLFGYLNQGDHSTFSATFYTDTGAGGSLLGTTSLDSATNAPAAWGSSIIAGNSPNFQSINGILPSLTKSIFFTVESTRLKGSTNDGYADNLNFSLSPVSAVPVPATIWLMGSALMGLLGFCRKEKN
jgi:hypothetical protein